MQKRYEVTGMRCAACSTAVERAVKQVPGVNSCQVSILTNMMSIDGDAKDTDIIAAVKKAGYGARTFRTIEESLNGVDAKTIKKRIIISLILLAVLMYHSVGVAMFGAPCLPIFSYQKVMWTFVAALALSIMIVNYSFFYNGFRGLIHLAPNMDTLVSLGSAASFIYSLVWLIKLYANDSHLLAQSFFVDNYFFDSAAMILVLISIGKYLEARSKKIATDDIKSLVSLSPNMATIIVDDKEIEVPVRKLHIGYVFVVKMGMAIPADGIVLSGDADVDESLLTGESILVSKKKDDLVYAGTINKSGKIICRVTKDNEDTTLSQIIRLVSDSAATKAPIARIADKISSVFVPVIIGISIITFILWMIMEGNAGDALTRAISVLVVSCPCSLGLATPVAIVVANGVGAKRGILFKTGAAIEMVGKINIAAIDKTGTITTGIVDDGKVYEDTIREDSKLAIKTLKELGIKTCMLTGDKKEAAEKIASAIEIDNVISELLPDEKANIIKELKKEGKVLMIGDGVNDSVALTIADASMAIGSGTDVAASSAEVILMKNSLLDAVNAIKISRKTLRIIKQNLAWAFCYNIIGIPLAMGIIDGWTLSPIFSAFAMSISSIIVVTNALRIRRIKL